MEKINLTTTKKVKKVAYIKSNNRAKKKKYVFKIHITLNSLLTL